MKLIMRFKEVTVAIICVLIASPLLVYGQTKVSLIEIIAQLNAKSYSMTALDKALMDFNISMAYGSDANCKGSPIVWNPITKKLMTYYYLPPNSPYLRLSSKEQYAQFEIMINGIRITLVPALGIPFIVGGVKTGELFSEIGKLLEVQFTTNEGNQLYVIAKFKDGKLQLVREKMNVPQ